MSVKSKNTNKNTNITLTPTEQRMVRAALHDHVLALESNIRRAARGHSQASDQGDTEAAEAFENARQSIIRQKARARALIKVVTP